MHLSSLIIGPVITEKAERMKAEGTYVMRVKQEATKVDIKNALRKYYDVEVASIRVLRTTPKTRIVGQGTMEKRHRTKRMIVRLTKKSKTLDLANFQAA